MKKIFSLTASLFMAMLTLVSCLTDNETETSPECAILSFSVGDIASSVTVKNGNNEDTIITKTISGSEIHFNIDQVNGRIFSIDSLPNWVDLTKVVPSFSSYGYVYYQNPADSLIYYLTSGSDSINLTDPVTLYALSTDGKTSKTYTVQINRLSYNTDTVEWKQIRSNMYFTESKDNLNPIVLNDIVYMFHNNQDGNSVLAITTDGETWEDKGQTDIDYSSVLVFKDKFYGTKDGFIYSSEDGTTWSKASDKSVKRLLAADKTYIYALGDTSIIASKDLAEWSNNGNTDLDKLPTDCANVLHHANKTNPKTEVTTMCGYDGINSNKPYVWFKISSDDELINEDWTYVEAYEDNLYPIPALRNFSITSYNGSLYAIGRDENNAYDKLYVSNNNGIFWVPQTGKYQLPENINDSSYRSKVACILTVKNEIWIVKGGFVWKGIIR